MMTSVKGMLRSLYFILRFPFLFLIRMVFPVDSVWPKEISHILLIRMDRLGDLVFSLPVIDNLRNAYPRAQIHMLVSPYLKDFAELLGDIDQVIVYEGFKSTLNQLQENHYDMSIDLLYDYTIKTALLCFLSKAPIRVGFNWGKRGIFFTHQVIPQIPNEKSMVQLHLQLLRELGVPLLVTEPKIELAHPKDKNCRVVIMHPGGTFPTQRWPKENFIELGRYLIYRYDTKVFVMGSVQEKSLVDSIVSGIKNPNAQEVFPLPGELVALLSGGVLFIGNNSGPLHLSAALGIMTASVLGPTDPILWWPIGDKHIVLYKDLSCSPCSKAYCRRHQCLQTITAKDMIQAVTPFMDKV
ncbi:MAG: glycosyltransferase family 9 protein [Candidatus Omnitrophica bacterium]|nr:glycosyltransferase family 9 protein [Candidatus Omnitrophota bacterium]